MNTINSHYSHISFYSILPWAFSWHERHEEFMNDWLGRWWSIVTSSSCNRKKSCESLYIIHNLLKCETVILYLKSIKVKLTNSYRITKYGNYRDCVSKITQRLNSNMASNYIISFTEINMLISSMWPSHSSKLPYKFESQIILDENAARKVTVDCLL